MKIGTYNAFRLVIIQIVFLVEFNIIDRRSDVFAGTMDTGHNVRCKTPKLSELQCIHCGELQHSVPG